MNWIKRLEAIAAGIARINAQGSRKAVERTLIRKRVQTATVTKRAAEWRERGK
jgi:hypothetical protein